MMIRFILAISPFLLAIAFPALADSDARGRDHEDMARHGGSVGNASTALHAEFLLRPGGVATVFLIGVDGEPIDGHNWTGQLVCLRGTVRKGTAYLQPATRGHLEGKARAGCSEASKAVVFLRDENQKTMMMSFDLDR